MKKFLLCALSIVLLLSFSACGEKNDDKVYYQNTELENLETFTSITGIEVNITEDCPESNSMMYNYLMDNNADGLGAVIKYEAYLNEYGFEKSDILSSEDSNAYILDEYIIITGTFYPQSNVIQYVVNIPNGKYVSEDETNVIPVESEGVQETEVPKDEASIYSEFCQLVDEGAYTEAVDYINLEKLPLNYVDANDYYQYAVAMKLYTETELLTYQDILEVVRILTEDVTEGFKDSTELIEKINSELAELEGTHVYKRNSNYMYDAFYLIISSNGEVILDMGESSTGALLSSSITHQLVYVNLENGSFYMLCRKSFADNIDYCEYGITILPDYLALSKAWGSVDDGLFAGNYVKSS